MLSGAVGACTAVHPSIVGATARFGWAGLVNEILGGKNKNTVLNRFPVH